MPELLIPTNAELMRIERDKLPELTMDDPIFEMFPLVNKDAVKVMWEQQDNFTGLQQPRGINGNPSTIKLKGGKRFEMNPAGYGEEVLIEEADIEERRKWGSFNAPAPLDDLIYEAQDFALSRRLDRIRLIGWTLLTTGTFSIPSPTGGVHHTDTYPIRTANAAVAWATLATATPLIDMRAVKLLERGYSVNFGRNAKAYMNQTTVNNLLNNKNSDDIGGKRREVGASIFSVDDVNKILAAQDLPEIVPFDKGYYDDDGNFQLWIPNGVVVIVGQRPPGQTVGEFQMTRNAVNDDSQPGAYTYVVDSLQTGRPAPRNVVVGDGFKGGPALFYPSAIVILDVSP